MTRRSRVQCSGSRHPLGREDRLAALNVLCVAHTLRGSAPHGLEKCDRLVRESGGDWRALNNRANALLAIGRPDQARRGYPRAIDALREGSVVGRVTDIGDTEIVDPLSMLVGNLEIARSRSARDTQLAEVVTQPHR
jgi:hypothetical protein